MMRIARLGLSLSRFSFYGQELSALFLANPAETPANLYDQVVAWLGFRWTANDSNATIQVFPQVRLEVKSDHPTKFWNYPFLYSAASSEPLVAEPLLYEWAPMPANWPFFTIKYWSLILSPSKKHSRISLTPSAYRVCADREVPEVWGVIPWLGIDLQTWSFGAGWGNHTSPA